MKWLECIIRMHWSFTPPLLPGLPVNYGGPRTLTTAPCPPSTLSVNLRTQTALKLKEQSDDLDCPHQASFKIWQQTGSKTLVLCIFLYIYIRTIVQGRKPNDSYECMGFLLNFYQYKKHKSWQILHWNFTRNPTHWVIKKPFFLIHDKRVLNVLPLSPCRLKVAAAKLLFQNKRTSLMHLLSSENTIKTV